MLMYASKVPFILLKELKESDSWICVGWSTAIFDTLEKNKIIKRKKGSSIVRNFKIDHEIVKAHLLMSLKKPKHQKESKIRCFVSKMCNCLRMGIKRFCTKVKSITSRVVDKLLIQFVFFVVFYRDREQAYRSPREGGNPKNPKRLLIAATCNPPPKPKCCGGVTAPGAGAARKKGQTDDNRRRGACVCLSQRRDARVTTQRQERAAAPRRRRRRRRNQQVVHPAFLLFACLLKIKTDRCLKCCLSSLLTSVSSYGQDFEVCQNPFKTQFSLLEPFSNLLYKICQQKNCTNNMCYVKLAMILEFYTRSRAKFERVFLRNNKNVIVSRWWQTVWDTL